MPKSLIISNSCPIFLVKSGETLKLKDLVKFLEHQYNIDKHANKIFKYLKMNCLPLDIDYCLNINLPLNITIELILQFLSKNK